MPNVDPRSQKCTEILTLMRHLLSAIAIALSQVTSHPHADAYLKYMALYLKGLHDLFPDYEPHPIHHMAMHLHEYLR